MELPELPPLPFSPYLYTEWDSPTDRKVRTMYAEDLVRAYALEAVRDLVDSMDAAVKNGDLPIECEDAVDWLAAAIRAQGSKT